MAASMAASAVIGWLISAKAIINGEKDGISKTNGGEEGEMAAAAENGGMAKTIAK